MWFDSWGDIARILLVGAAAYATLIVVLRVTGKRTLSQLNAFDLIVTIAFGSTVATILLSSQVSFSEGVVALGLLAGLQLLVAGVSARWPRTRTVITTEPVVVLAHGQIRHQALRENRLTEAEVRQAVRMQGSGDLSKVTAVVVETNGKLSVISSNTYGSGSALDELSGTEDL